MGRHEPGGLARKQGKESSEMESAESIATLKNSAPRVGNASLVGLPDVLTVEEAARVLRVGRNTAYEAVRCGQLPSVRIGRRVLVPKVQLQRLLEAGT